MARRIMDGNEAAATVAHALSDVIAIYPITPASPMGELSDAWSQAGRRNLWGAVPDVVALQSEGGAAGALHGALQTGALATTFTASQGLLLMLPNMYKVAGELTPAVIHVAARTIATHALSIFGDHSDVMSARSTGWAMLASASVQEAHDMALVAHDVTLRSRVPVLHFFDGFRTSHELAGVEELDDPTIRSLIDSDAVAAHRARALDPEAPVLRGTAQNPDVFFQAREACNPFYDACAEIFADSFRRFEELTGRSYSAFEYHGVADPEVVAVIMGSGAVAAKSAVDHLNGSGRRAGVVRVRLFRPFDGAALAAAIPESASTVVVFDRTKEPGAGFEPLHLDVASALAARGRFTKTVGVRYGLSGKEFTPAMASAVLEAAPDLPSTTTHTIGIHDDVTRRSIPWDPDTVTEPAEATRAVFYGLGSDGTVSANKQSVKIIGEHTDLHAQGYFVYDSKKSGAVTVSHLRFGQSPIDAPYLIRSADFVGIHQFGFVDRFDVTSIAAPGATFLINSPHAPEQVWDRLPMEAQATLIERKARLFVVDADRIAREAGLGRRVNTVLQTCFFAISGVLERSDAIAAIKASIERSYGKRGRAVLERNYAAVDAAIGGLVEIDLPAAVTSTRHRRAISDETTTDFVERVTARIIEGEGELLPVSAMPVDGTFPTGTARIEKRSIAAEIPVWDPNLCIDCGRCALVCPHAAIRLKVFRPEDLFDAPDGFLTKEYTGREMPGRRLTVQVAPDDCTGCSVCVSVCPAKSKEVAKHKAIDMAPKDEHLVVERMRWTFFRDAPEAPRHELKLASVRGSQLARPLFEFSGACAGCGETPYLKLATQLFGDRMVVANATGCSSIYGGNLPTTPWTTNADGRGPAWSNSLFEDNAEFGLGMRLALDHRRATARSLLTELLDEAGEIGEAILEASEPDAVRTLLPELKSALSSSDDPAAARLTFDDLVPRSVWIVGGDGWAYDIGFGGLDHVLASGRNVNILVMDTEVYSNTGGQASKATPRAAIAKFASGGKPTGKKDLGMIAMGYGDVYVAQVALGANMTQVVKAFAEAEAHDGPSLIIAYSPCIAHGIDMAEMADHQRLAVESGYWPLFRYDPVLDAAGEPGLRLDSRPPSISFRSFAEKEARFAMLTRANPDKATALLEAAQADIHDRWQLYEQMVGVHRTAVFEEVSE